MTCDATAPTAITEITRRALIDEINLAKLNWAGRLEEQAFLARLYDLTSMPSRDPRFSDADGDIWQLIIYIFCFFFVFFCAWSA